MASISSIISGFLFGPTAVEYNIIRASVDDAERIAARIGIEASQLPIFSGLPDGYRISPGVVALALDSPGNYIYIGNTRSTDTLEPERIVVWGQRTPNGVALLHVWGPSERFNGVLRFIAQKLVDIGLGAEWGHFPNIDTPLCNRAKQIVLPDTGDYIPRANGTLRWVSSPTGGICRVVLQTALNRLVAAGAPVETAPPGSG